MLGGREAWNLVIICVAGESTLRLTSTSFCKTQAKVRTRGVRLRSSESIFFSMMKVVVVVVCEDEMDDDGDDKWKGSVGWWW